MNNIYRIKNDRLEVEFRYSPTHVFSSRFETIGVVEQVTLDGKYKFCEPEQRLPGRVTCNGVGLCGEYSWDGLAAEARPGQNFPKIGLGLLRQRPEGGPYHIFKDYEVTLFPTSVELAGDSARFTQDCIPCMDIAAKIEKTVSLSGCSIITNTTIYNLGQRTLELGEYQHNFLSLDGLPVGPGYHLQIPFDGNIGGISGSAYDMSDPFHRISGFMEARGDEIHWLRDMDGHGFHKETEPQDLHPEKGRFWRLTHIDSPLSVSEEFSFNPSRLVVWGVEHCICTEVYVPINVEPGERQSWTRTWRFGCHSGGDV